MPPERAEFGSIRLPADELLGMDTDVYSPARSQFLAPGEFEGIRSLNTNRLLHNLSPLESIRFERSDINSK